MITNKGATVAFAMIAAAGTGMPAAAATPQKARHNTSNLTFKPRKPPGVTVSTKFGKTTISAKTYVDGSWIDSRHEVAGGGHQKNSTSGFGFDVKRFYLTFDQKFNDHFSARFRSDIETGDSVAHPNELNIFVKNAFIQYKHNKAFALRAGVADLPWVPYIEHLYGYRYVEHVLIDRAHFGTSADLGLHALGVLAGGKIDYQLSVINGGGYHNVSRSKSIDVSGRLGFHPTDQVTFALNAREGKLAANQYGDNNGSNNRAYRYDAVAAWVGDRFRLGVDGFYAKNYSSDIVLGNAPSDKAFGGSTWASYTLPVAQNRWTIFGRYDYVRPHNDSNSGQRDNFYIAGLEYQPIKTLRVALVYKRDRIKQGGGIIGQTDNGAPVSTDFNATNIQATGVPNRDASYDEVGIFAQYVF